MPKGDWDPLGVTVFGSRPLVEPRQHRFIELIVARGGVLATEPGTHHPLGEVSELERVLEVLSGAIHV
jgi:hypothetical protein